MNINELLVKRFHISKEAAAQMLVDNRVFINTEKAIQRQEVLITDAISIDGEIIQDGVTHVYYAYYKPRGIECTLNRDIKDNLLAVIPFDEHLYPVGRLDKESEGLLLLTNDGKLYKNIAFAENYKEKEYIVTVDKALTNEAINKLASGIVIMGQKTRPAVIHKIDDTTFSIILTQGLNRQIRRMCYKLGYEVMMLKRIRITTIELGNLKPGAYRKLEREDLY